MVLRLLASLLLLTAFMAGCSSSTPEGASIAIHGSTYDPASVSVQAGEHVHFANHDSFEHSVTADTGGSFDRDLHEGDETDIEFPDAGTYAFHCKYHPSMRGTVVVS